MSKWKQCGALLFAILIGVTAVPFVAVGQDKTPPKKTDAAGASKGLRVFFTSHSLQWYVPNPLGELAKSAGFSEHKLVGHQLIGGNPTQKQWDLAEEKNKAKQALRTGDVDVFVMAPIYFPDQGIENFVKLGLEHNPNMRFTVQVSWGAYDADMQTFPKGATAKVDRNKTPDQLKKIHEVNIKAGEAQADDINKKYGKGKNVLFLVPSAQATIMLRTKIFNKDMPGITTQGELFADSISHPTAPLQALNTYLHFAAIYR